MEEKILQLLVELTADVWDIKSDVDELKTGMTKVSLKNSSHCNHVISTLKTKLIGLNEKADIPGILRNICFLITNLLLRLQWRWHLLFVSLVLKYNY